VIKVGDPAPDFEASASGGRTVSLGPLRGRVVIIYFYPKSFTPGCTAETRLFRDNYDDLRALGAEVIGISTDNLDTQCRFSEKHQVSFPIVSDADRTISLAYGVLWPLMSVDKRVTVVVDEEGIVRAVFRHELQVIKHLDDVVGFLRKYRDRQSPK
jgi:peroxiredoxin Q/BCP